MGVSSPSYFINHIIKNKKNMKNLIIVPFDLETAKKINIGEIAGRIVTEKGQNRAEIVYEDNSSNCPLLVVIHSISVSADWFSATVIPDCHRFIVFLPKKSTIGSKNPIMGILEENKTFISSRPGCILYRLDEMESWAYLDDLLP